MMIPMNIQRHIPDPLLYEQDFHAWTEAQASALARGDDGALDLKNLAEEVRSLGASERRELQSRIITILEHLIKYQYGLNRDPADGWYETIQRERTAVMLLLKASSSLRRFLADYVRDGYPYARTNALLSFDRYEAARLDHYRNALPDEVPYDAEQVLDGDVLPTV